MNFYNIHDFLKIKSDIRIPSYEYFESRDGVPDLVVREDEVRIPRRAKRMGYFKAYFREKYILVDYGFGARISINFNKGIKYTSKYARFGSIDSIIRSIVHANLIKKGVSVVHSACISKNDEAFLFCGSPHTGKTSIVMRILNDDPNTKFMADDYTLIDESGKVYSYPQSIGVAPKVPVDVLNLPVKKK